MHSPKISVIIPVYNAEKYIRKCLDSIINQTFTDFEVLIIDQVLFAMNIQIMIGVFMFFIKKIKE